MTRPRATRSPTPSSDLLVGFFRAPLWWARLGAAAGLGVLAVVWLARPRVAGDTPFVWDGTNAFIDCLSRGDFIGCRHSGELDYWGLTSPIGDWPLLQHIPDLVAIGFGAEAHHTRELVFVCLSVAGIIGSVVLARVTLLGTGQAAWFWGFLLIVLSGPLMVYGGTTAGEALATGLLVLLVAATALRWPPPLVAVAALAACLHEGDVLPVRRRTRRPWPRAGQTSNRQPHPSSPGMGCRGNSDRSLSRVALQSRSVRQCPEHELPRAAIANSRAGTHARVFACSARVAERRNRCLLASGECTRLDSVSAPSRISIRSAPRYPSRARTHRSDGRAHVGVRVMVGHLRQRLRAATHSPVGSPGRPDCSRRIRRVASGCCSAHLGAVVATAPDLRCGPHIRSSARWAPVGPVDDRHVRTEQATSVRCPLEGWRRGVPCLPARSAVVDSSSKAALLDRRCRNCGWGGHECRSRIRTLLLPRSPAGPATFEPRRRAE